MDQRNGYMVLRGKPYGIISRAIEISRESWESSESGKPKTRSNTKRFDKILR